MWYIVLTSGLVFGFLSATMWTVAKKIHKHNISSSGYVPEDTDHKFFDFISTALPFPTEHKKD